MADGIKEKNSNSNFRVKSNPSRQSRTAGPNETSLGQPAKSIETAKSAVGGSSAGSGRCGGRVVFLGVFAKVVRVDDSRVALRRVALLCFALLCVRCCLPSTEKYGSMWMER